jgi:hypothetical protein
MTAPNVVNRAEIRSLTALVREAATLEIPVPESVTDELELHSRLTRDALGTQRELQAAHAALQSAPTSTVDAALKALTDASLRTLAAQALTDTLNGVALSRLRNAVFDQLPAFEAEAVSMFNAAVLRHSLNEAADDLPDLTQVVSPIDLSSPQARAVQVWRDGVAELHLLWAFYSRIAQISGDSVGPENVDGLGVNLLLACRLGSPGRFSVASAAAERFAGIGAGSDASRRYGQLAPFVVPAICGYALHLSTSENALHIRRAIQPAAAVAGI